MFFCGDFCGGGLQEPEIVVSNYQEARELEKMKSQIRNSEILTKTGTFAMIRRSKYRQLREECRKSNNKFVDKTFPADKKSLNFSIPNREITWRRISEIIPNCVMEQSGINPADIHQGNIGDCYFLASISALAQNPQRIRNIFLDNFEIDGHGIYKVIACVDGVVAEMVIDDFIPVYASTNRPVFCKANGREVWTMLLEKAWAKIKGSYGAISSGNPHEVLNTFTIAPCSYFEVEDSHTEQYKDLVWERLLDASYFNQPTCVGSRQKVFLDGLRPRHTYTVLHCVTIPMGGHNHRLMRMRNPWGDTEYTGFASESDTKFWSNVPKQIKENILPKEEANDGDFVLPFSEFIRNFDSIDICHIHDDYCFEFEPIKMTRCKPSFVRLVVEQEHEAYLTLQKVFSSEEAIQQLKKTGEYGYSRIIIGRDIGDQRYEYYSSKMQTNFGDLTIKCRFIPGTYVIYLQGDYPCGIQKFNAIFSYYYARLSERGNKKFTVLQSFDQSTFLHEVMLNHAHRMSADINKLSARPNDWIKSTLLYEQGGYGYVACSLQKQANFRLHISIDDSAIEREGFKLMTAAGSEEDIQPGAIKVYVFEMDLRNKKLDQLSFPPQGFRISKIV